MHRARTPVVSAIGHEPDTPLLDLVADVRASTPTDAAKLVVPDVAEELRRVVAGPRPAPHHARPAGWPASRPASTRCAPGRSSADPRTLLDARADEVARSCATAPGAPSAHRLDRAADDIDHHRARARALSPLATLRRGYAVLQDADGHVVTSVAGCRPPAHAVSVRVADGRIHATTTGVEHDAADPPRPPTAGAG